MAGPTGARPPAVTIGSVGLVRRPLEPVGSIYIAGEEWSARTADDRRLPRGTPIRVVAVDGLTAIVDTDATV
jgi:membrane-bound serine protease (ClpP class)